MREATQFCVGLENKPGSLATLCGVLNRGGANIEAIFATDDEESTWVNFIADPPEAAQDALSKNGYQFVTETVITLRTENKPGALERIALRLAKAEVNITYVYGSSCSKAPFLLVLSATDMAVAAKALASE